MSFAKDLHDRINAATPIIPTIHEKTFVDIILPLIDTDKEDVNLDPWFAVAGTPHQIINVIDEANNVLFTVPPILTTVPLVEDGDLHNSISAILYEFDAIRKSQHPGMGDVYLLTKLGERLKRPDDKMLLKTLGMWKVIDDRYNLTAKRFEALKQFSSANLPAGAIDPAKGDKADDVTGEFEEL